MPIEDAIVEEVGADVFSGLKEPSGKLVLLQEWLYGKSQSSSVLEPPHSLSTINFRLAPSIITRSELELLGISTPRFAYRAYLTSRSFTNLRRLKVIETEIQTTHADEKLKNQLLDGIKNSFSWMADSLLERPHRLRDYTILTCDLAKDYSEKSDVALTPFVTNVHVLVGGGQCAQAAVYMALCLSQAKKIYGIAEITKLCAGTAAGFPIQGLLFVDIVKFFKKKCDGVNGLASVIVGFDRELELKLAENAFYSYCINQIPVIVLTSIARMWGTHLPLNQRHFSGFRSILRYSTSVDRSDFNALPLGNKPKRLTENNPVTTGTKASDHHAVVLIGASKELAAPDSSFATGRRVFVINDPATYPFIECTLDEIYAARAYIQEKSKGAKTKDRLVTDGDLAPLTTLAVVPSNVQAALLNSNVGNEKDALGGQRISLGLLSMIHNALTGPFEFRGLSYSTKPSPACTYPVHLLEVAKRDGTIYWRLHSAGCALNEDFSVVNLNGRRVPLKSKVPTGLYWVHHIQEPDKEEKWSETIWFWPAAKPFIGSEDLAGFVVRDINGDTYRILEEFRAPTVDEKGVE